MRQATAVGRVRELARTLGPLYAGLAGARLAAQFLAALKARLEAWPVDEGP